MKKRTLLSLGLLILSFAALSQGLPASPTDFTSVIETTEIPKVWVDNYGNHHAYISQENKIRLTWNDNADNEAYYILIREHNNTIEEWILPPNTEYYLDSSFIYSNTEFIYTIQAVNEFGQSEAPIIFSFIPWPTLAASPDSVTATSTAPFRFTVSFTDRSDSEDGYTIFSSTDPNSIYSSANDFTTGAVEGTGEVLTADVYGEFIPGTTYYFIVRGFYINDDPGNFPTPVYGESSEIISIRIPGPEYLVAQQEGNNVRLTWPSYPDDSGSGSIFLYRTENGGENLTYLFQVVNDTTFLDTTAVLNVPYVYYLQAESGAGNYNLVSDSITLHAMPTAPVATLATFVTPTSFIANWEPVTDADHYQVFVITLNDSSVVSGYDGMEVDGTSLLVTGLKAWKRYAYFVKSVIGDQTSEESNVVLATPIKRLTFLTTCSNDPQHIRRWKIINPNKIPVEVWWQVNNTSQQGTMIAAIGESFFTTETIAGLNKTTLTWYDDRLMSNSSTKASTYKPCDVDSLARISTDDFVVTHEEPFYLNLYPNPSTGKFSVAITTANNDDDVNVEIANLLGSKMLVTSVRGNNTVEIDGSSYQAGFYIVKAYHNKVYKSIKLIKQ